MRFPMPALLLLLALFLLACDTAAPITPEPRPDGGQGGAGGASSVSSSVASSGSQGAGAGDAGGSFSCEPCEDTDGTRIVHRRQVTTTLDGYKRVDDAGMFDTLRAEPCFPLVAADGVLRCLPVTTSPKGYYADATCTTPLFLIMVGVCVKVPLYVGEGVSFPGECIAGTRIRKLAGEHVGDVYALVGATCTKVTKPAGFSLYLGGAEVTPGAFAIVEQSENAP
jgi:hypothetical protein